MNTYDQKYKDDEQYHYEPTQKNSAARIRPFNWAPLLLIPLFFILGWVTKGVYDTPNSDMNNPRYGVGGGPGAVVTPYPAGYVASPSVMPKVPEESMLPAASSDVKNEQSATPTVKPSNLGKASPTATPVNEE